MKDMTCRLLTVAALTWAHSAEGASMVNGDFATGDFSGWTLDTDGFPGTTDDFQVVGSPGDYQAQIQADYWSLPGDVASVPLNDVYVANTLYQELDTASSPGTAIRLTFDWQFTGEDGDPVSGDAFTAALHDGMDNFYGADGRPGFLIPPGSEYGASSFSALLDAATFSNTSGWLLEFQLTVGVNANGEPNGFGSTLRISQVALTEVAQAPIPPSVALLASGLPLLLRGRRRRNSAAA